MALGVGDQLLHGFDRQRRVDDEDILCGDQQRDRSEGCLRIKGQRRISGGMDDVRVGDQQQRVAVGRRFGDELAADNPVGSAAVFDDDFLFNALAEFRAYDVRHHASGPPGRKRHDHMNRPVRVARCAGAAGKPENQQQAQPD